MRFTTQFEMDERGSTPPYAPGMRLGFMQLNAFQSLEGCIASFYQSSFFVLHQLRSSPRSVSMARLHPLLNFHLPPINGCSSRDLTGLCHESTHLEVGFPLRCFQRLSAPHLATLRLPLAR